jgi:D-alanyl-D-alanine carboxypeptidase
MKRFLYRLAAVICACSACLALCPVTAIAAADPAVVTTNATAGWPQAEDINSTAGVLIEASTGTVLFNKSMDQQMYPASITKVLTTLVVLENGNMSDPVTMTQTGVNYAVGGSANQGTRVGEVFTLEQLVYGTMLASANDMATQMGEYIGGSIENFAAMMNARAAELGCTGTHFTNACGMPDPNHVTTAHDMALIMRAAVAREDFRKIAGTASYTIPATNMSGERSVTNHDPLLLSKDFMYSGLIGGKTGYTDAAQNTLVNAASRDGFTLICVTLHAVDAPKAAFDHVDLLNYGYDNFEMCEVLPAEYCEEGKNRIVVPKGMGLQDLEESVEEYDADGTAMLRKTYLLNGYSLGSISLTKENMEAYEKKIEEEAREAERAKNKETESEEAAVNGDGEKEKATMSGASKEQNGQKMTDAQKSAGEKVEKIKKIFKAIIAGMTVLIILFLILLIRYYVKSKHFD